MGSIYLAKAHIRSSQGLICAFLKKVLTAENEIKEARLDLDQTPPSLYSYCTLFRAYT